MLHGSDDARDTGSRGHSDASHALSEQSFALFKEKHERLAPSAVEAPSIKEQTHTDAGLEKAGKALTKSTEPTYKGEDIKIAVAPATHACASKEQFGQIARDQLGEHASGADVAAYVREVAKLNNIPNPANHKLVDGEVLKLPGHTSDGKMFTSTQLPRETSDNGDVTLTSQGRRPEENYTLTISKDHSLQVKDAAGKNIEFSKDPTIEKDRAELLELAEKRIKNQSEYAKFVVDLAKFESRAGQDKLANSEVHSTYQQIERLLGDDKSHIVQQNQKVTLAEQILSQSATPTTVEQGQHPTCNVANVESRMYTRKPSEAARLVTDLALTSHHVTADGVKIDYDGRSLPSLLPHNESRTNPPNDGDRSYASQIFQMGAITALWNSDTKRSPDVTVRYEDGENKGNNQNEGIFYYQGAKRNVFSYSPDLGVTDLETVYNRIAGTHEHGFVIQRSDKDWDGSVRFETLTGLEKRLTEAKEKGLYPAIVMVDTNNEPFAHDAGADRQNNFGGTHVVSVTDFDEKTKRVSIDGTWSANADHFNDNKLSTKELYYSSFAPIGVDGKANMTDVRELNEAVAHNRRAGTVDPLLELTHVRFNYFALQYEGAHEAECTKDFNDSLKSATDAWGDGLHGATPQERDRALRNIVDIVRTMNSDQLSHVRNTDAWKQIKPLFKDYIEKNCDKSDPIQSFAPEVGMI